MDFASDKGLKKCVINGKEVEDLNCAICHEVYVDPRHLQCNHSFCFTCIIDHVRAQHRKNANIECPICRGKINIPSQSLHMVMIQHNLLKNYPIDIFPKNIALANVVGKLNNEQEFCKDHPNKVYDHFCQNHMVLCCSKCLLQSHRICKEVIDIDECDSTKYADLLRTSQKIFFAWNQKKKQQTQTAMETAKQSAVHSFSDLRQDVLKVIKSAEDEVMKCIDQDKKEIQNVDFHRLTVDLLFNDNKYDKQSFVTRIGKLASCYRKVDNAFENLSRRVEKIATAAVEEIRANLKRKVDFSGLDCGATPTKHLRKHFISSDDEYAI